MLINRRSFLRQSACFGLTAAVGWERGMAGDVSTVRDMLHDDADFYPLWPERAEDAGRRFRVGHGGRVSDVHAPGLYVVRPARPNGAAVVIAAGGGYRHIAVGHEALPAARWLASLGITAVVLVYRLPGEGWAEGMEAPMADARQALHLVRSGAVGGIIDKQRVAFMGFSAGGHLMGLSALQMQDMPPALLMLLYPVVSVASPFTGSRTSRACLGDDPTEERAARWSLPPHVRADAPPLFMAYAADDPIVSPEQEALLRQAYQAHHRPCEDHCFPIGGHGFGMGRRDGPTAQWPVLAEQWMKRWGFV